MAFSAYRASYWLRRRLGLTEVRREKLRLATTRFQTVFASVVKHKMGGLGVGILVFFVLVAFLAPFFTDAGLIADPEFKFDTNNDGINDALLHPTALHPFGTDHNGKDILARVIWGSRISLMVGFLSSVIASVLGTVVGLVSGYWGGWRDEALMRVNDILLSLPWLALLLVLAGVLGGQLSLELIIVAIGLTSWNFTARVVRAQVLSVKERQFIERAKASGAGTQTILWKHIFPNVFPLVFANTILTVAVAILSESVLAFLGRVNRTALSWGVVLEEAFSSSAQLTGHWAWIIMPGLALVFVILGFSLLGYALDEVLNPRLRER